MGVDRRGVMVYNVKDVCVRSLPPPSPGRSMARKKRTVIGYRAGRYSSVLPRAGLIPPWPPFAVSPSSFPDGIAVPVSVVHVPRLFSDGRYKTRAENLTLHRVPETVGDGFRAPFRCTAVFHARIRSRRTWYHTLIRELRKDRTVTRIYE